MFDRECTHLFIPLVWLTERGYFLCFRLKEVLQDLSGGQAPSRSRRPVHPGGGQVGTQGLNNDWTPGGGGGYPMVAGVLQNGG